MVALSVEELQDIRGTQRGKRIFFTPSAPDSHYDNHYTSWNARNYDQMTGRFMQTDPVFTERMGYDAQDVANPRFDIDEGSFYHDQYGPRVLDPKNRTATSRWIKHANRVAFSHDSWSRTFAREKNATPKWWGDARGGVATINTIATVTGNMVMAATGTVLFGVANAITGTKNLGPRKWRF